MLAIGSSFDRYRIDEELGAGGMGRVYRAFDTRLQRRVALKVLLAGAFHDPSGEATARMLREARAAAAFEHPFKVAVYDIGEVGGVSFISMELVVGRTLRTLIGATDVPLSDRLRWLSSIAEVLAAAHEVGLVHRDVKPENVMLGADGAIKVLDFGIARRAARGLDAEGRTELASIPTITQGGASLGTPIYMAPEQVRAEPLDGRADQFAFAIVAYELLTGRHPWATGRDLFSVIGAIVSEPLPPFPAHAAIPERVQAALGKALSKAPDDRFSTMSELIGVLREASNEAPSARTAPSAPNDAPPGPTADLPRVTTRAGVAADVSTRPSSRRKTVGTLALALLVVGGAALWLGVQKPWLHEPNVGLAAIESYRKSKGADAAARESVSFWGAAARDFAKASAEPGAPVRYRAGKRFADAEALLLEEHTDQGISALRDAIRLDPQWAVPYVALSGALAREGKIDEALRLAEQAQQLEPDWWPTIAAAARANAYSRRLDAAIQEYRRALAKSPGEPALLGELALVYHAARLDAEAERFAADALKADPELVAPRILLAERALERGDGETALRESTRAVSVLPRSVPAKLALADALHLLGRDSEAREAYRSVLSLWQEQGSKGPLAGRMREVSDAVQSNRMPARTAETEVPPVERSPSERAPAPRAPAPRAPAARAPAPRAPAPGAPKPQEEARTPSGKQLPDHIGF